MLSLSLSIRTCTDISAYWMVPPNAERVEGVLQADMDLTTAAKKKKALDLCVSGQTSEAPAKRTRKPPNIPGPPPKAPDTDFLNLSVVQGAVGTATYEDYMNRHHSYANPVEPLVLPSSLHAIRVKSMDDCDLSVLRQHCEGLKGIAAVSEAQAAAVEKHTRGQHLSNAWFSQRLGRITASNMHDVMSTSLSSPALSTVKAICTPSNKRKQNMPPPLNPTSPLQYGHLNEKNAKDAYLTKMRHKHVTLRVEPCGFVINPDFPEIGASPDGLIRCACCPGGCLEVKCTFQHRNTTVSQACTDRKFCLDLSDDGTYTLKKTHRYYTQVQTQIFVTGSAFCDFVMWSPLETAIVRVQPDQAFWARLLQKSQEFFNAVCLPQLVACYFTRQAQTNNAPSTTVPLTALQTACPRAQTGKRTQKEKHTGKTAGQRHADENEELVDHGLWPCCIICS